MRVPFRYPVYFLRGVTPSRSLAEGSFFARGAPSRSPAEGSGLAPLAVHGTTGRGR